MCFHFSKRGSLKRKGLGYIQVERIGGNACPWGGGGGRLRGKGRKEASQEGAQREA